MFNKYKLIFEKKNIFFSKYETLLRYIRKIEDDDSYVVLRYSNGIWYDISEYVKG